jgi:hypothetical protein
MLDPVIIFRSPLGVILTCAFHDCGTHPRSPAAAQLSRVQNSFAGGENPKALRKQIDAGAARLGVPLASENPKLHKGFGVLRHLPPL